MPASAFSSVPPLADYLTLGNLCRYAVSELVPNRVKQVAQTVTSIFQKTPSLLGVALASGICAGLLPNYKILFNTIGFGSLGYAYYILKKDFTARRAETARLTADEGAARAEIARLTTETARIVAETARIVAETARIESITTSLCDLHFRIVKKYSPLQEECQREIERLEKQPNHPTHLFLKFTEEFNELGAVSATVARATSSFVNPIASLIQQGEAAIAACKQYHADGTSERLRSLHRAQLRLHIKEAEALRRCHARILERVSRSRDPLLPHLKETLKNLDGFTVKKLNLSINQFRDSIGMRSLLDNEGMDTVFKRIEQLTTAKLNAVRSGATGGVYSPFTDRSNHKDP